MTEGLKIKVKYGNREVEVIMPLSERTLTVEYKNPSTLYGAIEAVKAIIDKLKED